MLVVANTAAVPAVRIVVDSEVAATMPFVSWLDWRSIPLQPSWLLCFAKSERETEAGAKRGYIIIV